MNISILKSAGYRPLFINFDLYTDGDAEFKKELITLMIENLRELQQSLKTACQKSDAEIFDKTCHKIKPTLSMLEDKTLMDSIDDLKTKITPAKSDSIALFQELCEDIIKSLEKENN